MLQIVRLYPNPSKGIFNLSFTSEKNQDLIGMELVISDFESFLWEYTKRINLKSYDKGIYDIEININKLWLN